MSVVYSQAAINARLQGVATAIDAAGPNGSLKLLAGATVVSAIALAFPCGIASGGVLTFSGTLIDLAADNTGFVDAGAIYDASGNLMVSGLTAGIPLSGADILINNGLNSTLITSGQVVQVISATITGS
jgi:hypothetical protein